MASDLLGRASVESESAVGASFDGRVADVLVLVNAGEDVVAFENLAQNVYEYEVPLRPAEYRAFAEVGASLGLDSASWAFLEALVQ